MSLYRLLRQLSAPGAWLEAHSARSSTERAVVAKQVLPASGNGVAVDGLSALPRLGRVPGVATMLELGLSGDEVWFVADAVEGESLRWITAALARASGFIAPNEGLAVVQRVAGALAQLHARGVTHGDVSASNIVVGQRGEVLLVDTGVAAALGGLGEFGPARSEPNTIAPEQLQERNDAASDVFHLGLVLFELSMGRPLWGAQNSKQLAQLTAQWQGVNREKIKHVPEPWLTLLVSMLSPEPAARPAIDEVASVLGQAIKQNGWAVADDDVARLFERASQNRMPWFGAPVGQARELALQTLSVATEPSSPELPAVTPPGGGAVVARIATRKMTADELRAVRQESPTLSVELPAEVKAAMVLVERGELTVAQVEDARQLTGGGPAFIAALLDSGADEDGLISALGEQLRVSTIGSKRLAEASPGPELLAAFPLELVQRTHAVPLGLRGGTQVLVAMLDPMDEQVLAQLRAAAGGRSLMTFKAGPRALRATRHRLYPQAALEEATGELELDQPAPPSFSPSGLITRAKDESALLGAALDALLGAQGARGQQGRQLVSLAEGLARRLGGDEDVALARAVAQSLVAAALAANKLPHEVLPLLDLQEVLGFGTAVDEFAEAFHEFPKRMPDRPVVKAVVLAFAFTASTGEARPVGSRMGGALNAFRTRAGLGPALMELLTAELTG